MIKIFRTTKFWTNKKYWKISSKNQKLFPVTNSGYIGQKGVFCDENSPLNPISHYGKLKWSWNFTWFCNAVTLY